MILSKEEKHVTEISANLVRPNNETSITPSIPAMPQLPPDNGDIISLYINACDAEVDAIEANREETLRWCFYAREFKSIYKDFMIHNKVGEKKAKDSELSEASVNTSTGTEVSEVSDTKANVNKPHSLITALSDDEPENFSDDNDDGSFRGFSDDDDGGYYYDLNTGETYTKSNRSICAY
ncbi:8015_t:CDS:2 [Diversispora eburnea]|uniref:8015_t:CDS:1 n=1 Tax=Diversispora eburnea TaxID=1213867 RepID=A0A9N9FV29_9GLOM|nr:8015_t:CDS:2 [Diversispora eburnea]